MTNYYEDEIKKYKTRLEEHGKEKEKLKKALMKIEEDEEFFKRQIKSIEEILKKEEDQRKK